MNNIATFTNVQPVNDAPPVTLRDCHNGFCDELERLVARLRAKSVPPRPCAYASVGELAGLFEDQASYLREITQLLRPLFERVAVDAADYAGATEPKFDDIEATVEADFIALIQTAVIRMGGE